MELHWLKPHSNYIFNYCKISPSGLKYNYAVSSTKSKSLCGFLHIGYTLLEIRL